MPVPLVDMVSVAGERVGVDLHIRAAVAEDVPQLASLASATFRATYGPVVDAATVEAVVEQACSEAAFLGLVRRASADGLDTLLVAVEDGQVVAFLDFGQEPEGLELRRLYTQVGDTSRGVGSALLGHFENALPPGTRYRIVVLAANERGLAFWRRHGFRTVSEIDGIEHFAAHRGVQFAESARPEPLLIMEREVE